MIYNLYTIFDKVADECGPIFQAKNFKVAERYVLEMIKGNSSLNLDEYYLCYLGQYDSDAGSIWPDPCEKWILSSFVNPDFNNVSSEEEVEE